MLQKMVVHRGMVIHQLYPVSGKACGLGLVGSLTALAGLKHRVTVLGLNHL